MLSSLHDFLNKELDVQSMASVRNPEGLLVGAVIFKMILHSSNEARTRNPYVKVSIFIVFSRDFSDCRSLPELLDSEGNQEAIDAGESVHKVAERFHIGIASVSHIYKRWREKRTVERMK
jgi:hypothetical protein